MATQTVYADSVSSGSCTSSGNVDTNGFDNTWTADTANTNWTCAWLMTASSGDLDTTTNGQSVTVRARKEVGQTGSPSYVINVYEGGNLRATSSTINPTDSPYTDSSLSWTSLGGAGDDVTVELVTTGVGGPPSTRASVQADGIAWDVLYIIPPQIAVPTGIPSAEAVGTPVGSSTATAVATGIASTSAVGTPVGGLSIFDQTAIATGISNTSTLGTPVSSTLTVAIPSGISPTSATGTPVSSTVTRSTPTGIAAASATGTPTVDTTATPDEYWGFLTI